MKSFRQILGEVAQPKPEEERAFKDLHTYETMPHPVALDHQFTGAIGADDLPKEKAKRLADQEGDANYDTSYDDAFEYEGPSFAEEVAQNLTDRLSEGSKMAKSAALSKASETSKSGKAKVSLKKAPWDKNEEVDLDEAPRKKGAPKITGDSIAIQRAKDAEHNKAMGRTRTGRKKPERTMTSTQKSLASMRRECAGELEEASASVYKDMPKAPGKMVSNRVQVKAFKDTNAMGAFLGKQNDNSWQQTGVAGLKSGKYKIDMVKKGGKPSKNFIKVNEEVELDEGFSPKQIEQLKKAYASMPDRVPMDMAKKMSAVLKGRSKEELIAIARADIKWLSTTAATNLIMQGVKAKEING